MCVYICVRVCICACVVDRHNETRARAQTVTIEKEEQMKEVVNALPKQELARPAPKKLDRNQLEDTTKDTAGGIDNFMKQLEGIERKKQSAEER